MARIYTLFILFLTTGLISAQNTTFQATPLKPANQFTALFDQFHASEVYQVDVAALDDFVKTSGHGVSFGLQFGTALDLDLSISPRDIRHSNYTHQVSGNNGLTENGSSENITFRGQVNAADGGSVALTIDEDFILGFFEVGGETYYIEPLWYFVPGQPKDRFVVYKETDVKPTAAVCGVHEVEKFKDKITPPETTNGQAEMMGCVEVEFAVASDFTMFQKFGSAGAVESHILAILNAVQTNFDNEFNDEIQLFIITQFTVTSSAGDPWTNSNNATVLLNDFRSWGNSGGFGVNFDLGELWTNRPLNGIFGIAYLSSVCGFSKYHVVRDYSSNTSFVQKTTAHEIGHNFSATHDPPGSGNIMSQGAFSSNSWSIQSQNQINGFYPGLGCLGSCVTSQPPIANFSASPTEGCIPFTVNYQDLSTGATDWQWSFPGGVPATSTEQNPSVTYFLPGSYGASLVASNPIGSSISNQGNIITVETEPVAAYNFTLNGLTIIFENASSANATELLWEFGDGNSSMEENPIHTYDEDGFYDVTLTATNECGSQSLTLNLPAFTVPSAGFSATPSAGCAALDVEFTNNSSANSLTFFWEFEGGTPATSTEENPSVTYTAPGNYSVSLTVANPAGTDTETQTEFITVGTLPTPGFNFTVDGSTVTFENTSDNSAGIGPMAFAWDFGDMNESTEENPEHTYTGNGEFDVTLSVTNDCGTSELTQTVSIEVAPTAGFSASATSGCEPFEVTFNNTSAGNATEFAWDFPGGDPSSSTEENPTVTYDTPGTYDVALTVTNSAGSDMVTFEDYITVSALASAGFTSSGNGLTYNFTNTSTNATTYEWDFGDMNESTEENPEHTYSEDGTYTVTLTATNACGSHIFTETVEVVSLPTAAFSASQTTGCAPLTVQFTNESSENATSFEWEFSGGDPSSSTEENPTVTYNDPGEYSVTLTASNAAGENTSTQTNFITVEGGPTAGFSVSTNGFTANFSNTSNNAISYEWDFGDMSPLSSEADPEHTYSEDGEYEVTLTATNDCGTDVFTQTITVTSLPQAAFSASQTTGCEPFTVEFTNESSENSTSFEWDFPGGDPSTSTAENPTVTYDEPGVYSVTLTAINSLGESTVTETDFIAVGTGPGAGFTSDGNLLTVAFTNTSTNPANSGDLTYDWDFGDLNESTEENPTHTYAEDGEYEVTLTVSNDCGSATFTQTVSAVSLPTAAFSASQTTGCEPFTVEFINESSENATNFEWEFQGGDPAVSSAENPTVTYNMPGAYAVVLTASNAAGEAQETIIDYIIVGAAPSANFSAAQDLLTVTFTNSSTNPANSGDLEYHWDFGDMNESTAENPEHTYAEDGEYEVILTVTNDCGSATYTQVVTVSSLPSANFSAQNTDGCVPFEVQFMNLSSANAESFEWTFPGGEPATSTEENPVVIYNVPGTYDVTLTVTNSAGEDTHTEMGFVTVDDVPTASFDSDVVDNTVSFSNTSTNATSFEWDFGDMSPINTEANPQYTYSEDGAYTVTLTATNDCGSVTTEELIVIATQGQAPVAAFEAELREGCVPLEVTFTNLSSANAETFEWTFPGGDPATSTEENPTVLYTTPGTFDVTLTASNINGSDTYEEIGYVIVGGLPTADFTFDTDELETTFTNTSSNPVNSGDMTFDWDFGDMNFSEEESPVHTYAEPGEYTVTLTVTNDCGISASSTTVVVMANSVGELPGIELFSLFPNPNRGSFVLVLEGKGQPELEITFTNVLGQVLKSQPVNFGSGKLREEFVFGDLAAGTYILQVRSGGRALFKKVMVQ